MSEVTRVPAYKLAPRNLWPLVSLVLTFVWSQALALAMAYQSVTDHNGQRPPIDDLGPNDEIHW
jgi:hypothetical protein